MEQINWNELKKILQEEAEYLRSQAQRGDLFKGGYWTNSLDRSVLALYRLLHEHSEVFKVLAWMPEFRDWASISWQWRKKVAVTVDEVKQLEEVTNNLKTAINEYLQIIQSPPFQL